MTCVNFVQLTRVISFLAPIFCCWGEPIYQRLVPVGPASQDTEPWASQISNRTNRKGIVRWWLAGTTQFNWLAFHLQWGTEKPNSMHAFHGIRRDNPTGTHSSYQRTPRTRVNTCMQRRQRSRCRDCFADTQTSMLPGRTRKRNVRSKFG